MLTGLLQFTERFKQRLIQMALLESDPKVRLAAIDVVASISSSGLFEQADRKVLTHIAITSDDKTREHASEMLASIFEEDFKEADLLDARAAVESVVSLNNKRKSPAASHVDEEDVSESMVGIKALARMVHDVAQRAYETRSASEQAVGQSLEEVDDEEKEDEEDDEEEDVNGETVELKAEIEKKLLIRHSFMKWSSTFSDFLTGSTFLNSYYFENICNTFYNQIDIMKVLYFHIDTVLFFFTFNLKCFEGLANYV
jgi:uncharacterized membrane protein YdfJ with MMPL/SSD domain